MIGFNWKWSVNNLKLISMAWRIHDSVIRGEIDNRVKGIVRGRLWFHGFSEPVVLELTGNAWPDLAGCLLQFQNPGKTIAVHGAADMKMLQRGTIGDLTASRKVRVLDIPVKEAYLMSKAGGTPPEHMANSLYLEWFGDYNGRVVIESADYQLTISAPEWRLTPEENEQRARDAAAGMDNFMKKLTDAVEAQRRERPENKEWDEFDNEKFLRECDARTDKYLELLDKYGDTPEAEERIAKEMGWDKHDDSPEHQAYIDELNAACEDALENPPQPDPITEGKDWIRIGDDDIAHPLAHRAHESVIALMLKLRELGFEDTDDEDLVTFESEFQITGAKLAGALNGLGYHDTDGGFVVACLKRALSHLHTSQAGLEKLAPKKILPDDLITQQRNELFAIREEILRLMNEFRGKADS